MLRCVLYYQFVRGICVCCFHVAVIFTFHFLCKCFFVFFVNVVLHIVVVHSIVLPGAVVRVVVNVVCMTTYTAVYPDRTVV